MSGLSKKALKKLVLGAFFSPLQYSPILNLFVTTLLSSSVFAGGWREDEMGCRYLGALDGLQQVQVRSVTDGDTVVLKGGDRVRLIGLNAPELKRRDNHGQPYGEEAKSLMTGLLAEQSRWYLLKGINGFDRHGRVLGHLLDDRGYSVSSRLVANGSAFAVVKWPDIDHGSCFLNVEKRVREKTSGIWGIEYWSTIRAKQVDDSKLGFRLIEGVVTKVDVGERTFIELDDKIVLRLLPSAVKEFVGNELDGSKSNGKTILGRKLEVRGWLRKRNVSKYIKAGSKNSYKVYIVDLSSSHEWSFSDW